MFVVCVLKYIRRLSVIWLVFELVDLSRQATVKVDFGSEKVGNPWSKNTV